jgi:hypothetical protein
MDNRGYSFSEERENSSLGPWPLLVLLQTLSKAQKRLA